MRNGLAAIVLLLASAVPSLAAGTKPNDKVILTVSATIHASAHRADSESKYDDEVTATLKETVVYKIIKNSGKGNIELKELSFKNQMTASGQGATVWDNHISGNNTSDWTYTMDPEYPRKLSAISKLNAGPPFKVLIQLSNFFDYGHVRASGKSTSIVSMKDGVPIWETSKMILASIFSVPVHTFFNFNSMEEVRSGTNALAKQLQTTYTPREGGGFFASGSAVHSYKPSDSEKKLGQSISIEVDYTVDCGEGPERAIEVSVEPEPGYESWIPKGNVDEPKEPGSEPLKVTVTVHKKDDKKVPEEAYLNISLPYVSKNKGVCGNWPKNAGEEEGLRFWQKDPVVSKGVLQYVDPTHLKTDALVEMVTFHVYGYDYGAWGTLRVTATDKDGKDLKVKVRGKDTPDLDIPLDEDANRIADAWKPEETKGKHKDWDDETVAGQDTRGDGLTLYDEYRGLVVLENGKKVSRRLDPSKKELFVIDDGKIFDAGLWQQASDITVFKLDDQLVKGGAPDDPASRIVDFNGDGGGHKYCVRLVKYEGLVEGTPYQDQKPDTITNYGYTDNQGNSPKTTLRCVVFPARLRAMIDRVASYVANGVKDPSSEDGKALQEAGIPTWLAQKALDRLDQATRDLLAKQMTTLVAIHEMGHACGLVGHLDDKGTECEKGDPKCPMKYADRSENRRLLILQVIFALDHPLPLQYDRFCGEGFNCYGGLNVKD